MFHSRSGPVLGAVCAVALTACKDSRDPGSIAVDLLDKLSAPKVGNPHSDPQTPIRTEISPGNPGFGKITVYGQVHWAPNVTPEREQEIGLYQGAILLELLKQQPRHVFEEGRSQTVYSGGSIPNSTLNNSYFISDFSGCTFKSLGEFTPSQLESLALYGAAEFYVRLQPLATLYSCAPDWVERGIHGEIEALDPESEMFKTLTFSVREQFCANQVFSLNSGAFNEGVAVIFGRDHHGLPILLSHQFSDANCMMWILPLSSTLYILRQPRTMKLK